MKNLTPILLASLLTLGAVACDNTAKTSSTAPNSTSGTTNLEQSEAKTTQSDATDELRRKQLNADIRAREERSNVTGVKTDLDLASEVRSKLEANIPASALTINSKDGVITVAGTLTDKANVSKIEPLAKEIDGVKSVKVDVKVDPSAKPPLPPDNTSNTIDAQTNDKK